MRTCGKAKKGTPVIFVKKLTINEGDEDERKNFMHRSFTVFNVAQIEELPKEEVPETVIPDDAAHHFIAATLAAFGRAEIERVTSRPRIISTYFPSRRSRTLRATTRPLSMNSDIMPTSGLYRVERGWSLEMPLVRRGRIIRASP